MIHLEKATLLAVRNECLEISRQAMALFDSLEGESLTPEGSKAASLMAGRAQTIHSALHAVATAELLGLRHR